MSTPMAKPGSVPITLAKSGQGEILKMGDLTIQVIEDGSSTDNRIGSVMLTIAPNTTGPPQHWHRMHDETFFILKGTVRFTTGKTDHDASAGDCVIVPPKSFHTFSNPYDEEASFYNTFTPAYYVDYLRMLADAAKHGEKLSKEENLEIMAKFATFGVTPADLEEVY